MSIEYRILKFLLAGAYVTITASAAFCADAADREFAYAEALSKRGLDKLAVLVMEQFARDFPDHPRYEESLLAKARYQHKAGDLEASLATVETFLQKHSYSRFKVEALCQSAELYYDLRRWPQAVERLQTLLTMKEQLSPEWLMRCRYYLAWCKAELGEHEEAMNRFRDFGALCPDTELAHEARLAMGDCLRRLKKYEEAFAVYGRVLGEASGMQAVNAAFGMGLACLEAKEYRRAVIAFSEVVRRGTDSPLAPHALLRKAECLKALGDMIGARTCLMQLVTEFSNSQEFTRAADLLGRMLLDDWVAKGKHWRPRSDIELYVLVTSHIRAKRLNDADQVLQETWERTDGAWTHRACVALARAMEEVRMPSHAATWYERAHARASQNPDAPNWLLRAAYLRQQNGEYAASARLYEQVLSAHSHHPHANIARWNLAQLRMKEGRYVEAAGLFETLVSIQPSSFSYHPNLYAGLAWALAGQHQKAVAAYQRAEQAKQLDTAPPEVLLAYAEALTHIGSMGRAVEILRVLIARQKEAQGDTISWANYRLGHLCERAGAWEEAASAFARADSPSAPAALRADALLHWALALYRGEQTRECATVLIELMKRYPNKSMPAPTYAWLACQLLQAGDAARARRVCEAMERAYPDHHAFAQFIQARCDMALGNYTQAARRLQGFDTPDVPLEYAARRLLADCLHRIGEGLEAEKVLRHLLAHSAGRAAAEAEVALGELLLARGRPGEASAIFRHVILIFDAPRMRDLVAASYAGLAVCQEQMGQHSHAQATRARLKALNKE